MNIKNNSLVKVISVLCAAALLLTALFANPVIISALTGGSDDSVIGKEEVFDTPVVYGFETSENPVTDKSVAADSLNMTRGGDNMGVMGWTWDVIDGDAQHGKVLYTHNESTQQTWATSGGYRLNNNDGVYRLEESTTYYVEMEVNMTSAPSVDGAASELYMGYGSWDNKAEGNSNGVDSMGVKLYTVVKAEKDATVYSTTSSEGTKEYDVNSGWHTLKFVFTTPADFGGSDNALAFYALLMPGAKIQIDNVKVSTIPEDEGIVIFKDELHGKTEIVFKDINLEVELPVITPENPEHTFEGWYSAEERNDESKVVSNFKMETGITVLYARFKAPVTITFTNTITGETETATGMPGDIIAYPIAPSNDEKWFAGWFTTASYTEEYTSKTYPYANKTLYSKWIDPSPIATEDFENYESHKWEEIIVKQELRDEKGPIQENGETIKVDAVYKSNYLYFGRMCYLEDKITYGSSGHSLKYTWDADMMLDPNDPETYYAPTRHNQWDAATILEDVKLTNNTTYVVTYKYYVETLYKNVNVTFGSGNSNNIWGNMNTYQNVGGVYTITAKELDGQWHEAKAVITTDFKSDGKSMYVNVNMKENSDAVIYFDDFVFTPVKPSESYVVYSHGIKNEIYTGTTNSALPHTLANADEVLSSFDWYADANFGAAFTETVFGYEPLLAYAMEPITFAYDYPYTTEAGLAFGRTMAVVNEKGVGNGDNYALKIHYNGDDYYGLSSQGKDLYMRDRYNSPDFQALAKTGLKDDTVYIITYDVKAENATLGYYVQFTTAAYNNVWGKLVWPALSKTSYSKSTSNEGYITCTTAIKTGSNLDYGNALFLCVTFAHNLENQSADIYIDNLLVREATGPVAVFANNNDTGNTVVKGTVGGAISYPSNPEKFGYVFNGWYTDKECTQPLSVTKFNGNEIIYAYAGYDVSKTNVYDYEDYNVPYQIESTGPYMRSDCEVVKVPFAYSGDYVMKLDRSTVTRPDLNPGGGGHLIKNGSTVQRIDANKNYLITFKYYIEKHGQEPLRVAASASAENNLWAGDRLASQYFVSLDEKVGVWHTGTFVCSGKKITASYKNSLFITFSVGNEGLYYLDDISVTELEEGVMGYFVDNSGCLNIPEYVLGKPGESYASQLPKNPKYDNHQFLGYFVMGSDGKYVALEDMKFYDDKEVNIVARFIRLKTIQDFETYYAPVINSIPGYSILDYDYELYDALAKGNSRDNVTSGRYSLHRLGKTHYFENALLLTSAQQIVAGEKYTVTFKVKMPSYLQTDGAVKIVCNNSPIFAWATFGDYYPVVAIKDLVDGQWHEVSYTFTAIEPYVAVQTPGYCELFIDDVVFTHVSPDAQISAPVPFTEYVPAMRDLSTGELLEDVTSADGVDISTIVDSTLKKNATIINNSVLGIIIPVAIAVVVIAAAVVVLIIVKKKKKA
ncbi:MAG: InlB B-repeat-containing protein [Acutalibacteraceae bacterium]|nr:InlB B-repeat-containing protein [Acutalibacteraceae bacterium]